MGHLNRGKPGVEAFVATFQAGTIDGLLERVAGEHTKNHWHAGIKLRELDAAGGFRANVIVMRSLAAQNAADADDGLAAAGFGKFFGGDGNFERAGDPDEFDLAFRSARSFERVESRIEQPVSDELIEAAHYNSETQARGGKLSARRTGSALLRRFRRHSLFAFELRGPLFDERARAFAHVFRRAAESEKRRFEE